MLRQQHTITEHVTGHITNSNTGEISGLAIDTNFAEVPFYCFPAATGRDAHFLMVIAVRTAGGKGIAQPETVIFRDTIRNIREGRRTFVGRNNQVRIIFI